MRAQENENNVDRLRDGIHKSYLIPFDVTSRLIYGQAA
jgi:hypothetical protein